MSTGTRATDAPAGAYRTCPLCEAGCGLTLTRGVDHGRASAAFSIRGDVDDVASKGFLCPKGAALGRLHDDPDRLRTPLIRRGNKHVPVSWEQAWQEVHEVLRGVIDRYGPQSVSHYIGNPNAHNLAGLLYTGAVGAALGSPYVFSAGTVDQQSKQVAVACLYGEEWSIPVPDIDRTDYLLVIGANPYVSNGSLWMVPGFPGRVKELQRRSGRLVVVDPRRSRTANAADEWISIIPGTDALFLMAIVHTLFADDLVDLGTRLECFVSGVDEMRRLSSEFAPDTVQQACGIDAAVIRRVAHELAAAPAAAVYGRVGTTTQTFGTTTSWLIEVVNVLTGNLDRPGGVLWNLPAVGGTTTTGTPRFGTGFVSGEQRTQVRGVPVLLGQTPVAVLAEEIEAGHVRGFITLAGNPVCSTPNSARLDAALGSLDAMISIDFYLNETTRHAHVILPPPGPLQKPHYDVLLASFGARNVARYSPRVMDLDPGQPDEWELFAKVAMIASGAGPLADPAELDMSMATAMAAALGATSGRDGADLLAEASAEGRVGPDRLLDLLLRTGPYGLSLDDLRAAPHGIDLGPLGQRLPDVLRTPSGTVELAHPWLTEDVSRLHDRIDSGVAGHDALLLVGRRNLRSNNSWMHNVDALTKGASQCTMHIHPDDARTRTIADGDDVLVRSRRGEIRVPAQVTMDIRPGVVSIPHGWGHDVDGIGLDVARLKAGSNSNMLADEFEIDPRSGTSVLNGIPVSVCRARPSHPDRSPQGGTCMTTLPN